MKALRCLPLGAAVIAIAAGAWADDAPRRRPHINPITTAATTTQSINETRDDTARINAAFRARSTHYHRPDGAVVYIDTVTGEEWIDSASITTIPKMKYGLLQSVSVGVDVWDPVMRLFGQKFGIAGLSADVNLHNRYFPTLEAGLGVAARTPSGKDYTYRSPLSAYFKIGADYNFLYNSDPDYRFTAGVRYGFSAFRWGLTDVEPAPGYWGATPAFTLPYQNATAGWIDICLGLRVRLIGPLSAGWMLRFHAMIHESKNIHGEPWYIPGFGSRGQAITGSFHFTYTIPLNKHAGADVNVSDTIAVQ